MRKRWLSLGLCMAMILSQAAPAMGEEVAEAEVLLMDDEAAVEAQEKLLSMIFEQCDSLADIETLLQQADKKLRMIFLRIMRKSSV